MSEQKSNDDRARNWVAVLYPESLPSNWVDILDNTCVPWCCSPLHDKDIDGDGNPKKAHYHILLKYNGKKSFNQIKEVLGPLNCPIPQKCQDVEGAVRYMAHIDTPHKFQYSPADIIGHNGFDVAPFLRPTTTARYEMLREMTTFISKHHITEFSDFTIYCQHKRSDTWYPLLCDSSTLFIREFIKSNRHRSGASFIDYDTGEVILDVES